MGKSVLLYFWIIFPSTQVPGLHNHFGDFFLLQFPFLNNGTSHGFLLTLSKVPVSVTMTTIRSVLNMTVTRNIVTECHFAVLKPSSGTERAIKITSTFDIAVCVILTSNNVSMETFTAVPVASFGFKYYIITLRTLPFIVVVTDEPTDVVVTLRSSENVSISLSVGNKVLNTNVLQKFALQGTEALILSDCMNRHNSVVPYDFTGTHIHSTRPVGVISGNCGASDPCKGNSSQVRDSVSAEMLLPIVTHGKEFITFFVSTVNTHGHVTVVASADYTEVSFHGNAEEKQKSLLSQGDSAYWTVLRQEAQRLSADKPVAVFLTWSTHCSAGETPLDSALVTLLPVEQFYNKYLISLIPGFPNWAVFVIENWNTEELIMNKKQYTNIPWSRVDGSNHWHWAYVKLSSPVMSLRTVSYSYFGCYHVIDDIMAAHAAGFRAVHINKLCSKSTLTVQLGDETDDDCDGWVDEERFNGEDDDNDGLRDEDLMGSPFDCPPKRYGHSCSKSCSNCVPTCDVISGYCVECLAGYTNPTMGCQEECPAMTYGLKCTADCFEKCRGDCVDRVNGSCLAKAIGRPSRSTSGPSFWTLMGFFSPAIMIIIVFFGISWYHRSREFNASEIFK